jgi:hypothetical protein
MKIAITESKLKKLINLIVKEDTNYGGETSTTTQKMDSNTIKMFQNAIKNTEFKNLIGNYGPNGDGVDGMIGPKTLDALNKFQQKNNITGENGIIGPKTLTAIKPLIKTPQTKTSPVKLNKSKSYLLFDGKTLKFIINGKVVREWNAWSGRTKYNANTPYQQKLAAELSKLEFMKFKENGPIPQGTYSLGAIQTRTNGNSLTFCANKDWVQLGDLYRNSETKQGANHDWNSGGPQDLIAWGNYRIPIVPKQGTNTFGRGSFYLHGGGVPGSIGCIDLVDKIDSFVNFYTQYLNGNGVNTIDVYVDYSGNIKNTQSEIPSIENKSNMGEPLINRIYKNSSLSPFSE